MICEGKLYKNKLAPSKKNAWELVNLPKGKKIMVSKWVYKTKFNNYGNVERHKARLVAKGFTQRHELVYE